MATLCAPQKASEPWNFSAVSEVASVKPNWTPTFIENAVGAGRLTLPLSSAGFSFAAIFVTALGLVFVAAEIVEQRGTNAMNLAVERTCVRQILDLAEHFHANTPALGEVVFASPAIFEAKPFLVGERPDLLGEERIEGQQEGTFGKLDDGAEPELIGVAVDLSAVIERLLIASLEGKSDPVALTLEQCELGLDLDCTCLASFRPAADPGR